MEDVGKQYLPHLFVPRPTHLDSTLDLPALSSLYPRRGSPRRDEIRTLPNGKLSTLPTSILINPLGYISGDENCTTAHGSVPVDDRIYQISVTFWPAYPPSVSFFTVNCPGLPRYMFGDFPKIITTSDNFVLLRVNLHPPAGLLSDDKYDYFVYHAGSRPSLHLIPMAPVDRISDGELVLMQCHSRKIFFVAILRHQLSTPEKFDLHLYDSGTGAWSTRKMSTPEHFVFTYATKVIIIGGDLASVGWVDLWRGILICDLLGSDRLRYVPLPAPIVSTPLMGPASSARDITAVNGEIKYFEMHIFKECPYIIDGCEARTMILSKDYSSWKEDCKVELSMDDLTHPSFAKVLRSLQGKNKSMGYHIGFPVLSLRHDIVYIMNKFQPPNCKGNTAWVIAIDMRRKTGKYVAKFIPGRPLGSHFALLESQISQHLDRLLSSLRTFLLLEKEISIMVKTLSSLVQRHPNLHQNVGIILGLPPA